MDTEILTEEEKLWRDFCYGVDCADKFNMHFVETTGWQQEHETIENTQNN